MPRGERSGDPDVVAKRRATFARKRVVDARVRADRLLHHLVPQDADIAACRAWLAARGVAIDNPAMRPRDRRRWILRARKEMCDE